MTTPPVAPHIRPDPGFAAHLEWEVRSALRRAARFHDARPPRVRWRRAAVSGLAVVAAFALGAIGVLTAQEVRRSRAAELVSAQYRLRHEIAQMHERDARDRSQELQRAQEQGLASEAECAVARERHTRLALEASLADLDAIETGVTGRPPDRRIAAPLVAGRDLVMERLDAERAASGLLVDAASERLARTRALHAIGAVSEAELDEDELRHEALVLEAGLVDRQADIRRRLLRGEVDEAHADLLAAREAALVAVQRETAGLARARAAAGRARQLLAADAISTHATRDAESALTAQEAELRRATLELETIEAQLAGAR